MAIRQAPGNRLVAWKDLRFTYDAWGNLTEKSNSKGGYQRFHCDCENRLTKAETWNGTQLQSEAQYSYDSLGRRISKSVTRDGETQKTDFLWQGLRLLQEHNAELSSLYVYEPSSYAPLARIDNNPERQDEEPKAYFHTDQIGTPQEVTDADGHIVWRAWYKAWGSLEALSPNAIEQNLRFQGQYHDRETGLHYNTFRYYDPAVGRFTTQDPIGLLGGINLYQYAPNAQRWVDPLGLCGSSVPNKVNNISTAELESVFGQRYAGVKEASQFLQDAGVPREFRKQILGSFDIRTLNLRKTTDSEFGIRYFDNVNAWEKGRYLFETFPASRQNLALKPEWNQMTYMKQFQIRPSTTVLEGRASSMGLGVEGGQIQKYILDLNDLVEP